MTTIIGVDISKSKFDVRYLPQNTYQTYDNTPAGIQIWLKELKKITVDIIVLENTGGYEKLLVKSLHDAGLPVHIAAGDKIRYFARYKGFLSKTDKQDAYVIALYAQENKLELNAASRLKDIELRELQSRQNQVKKSLSNEKRHLDKGIFSKEVLSSIKRTIKKLDKEIELLEQKILDYLKEDRAKKETIARYETVKGIGEVSARQLAIYLPELGEKDRGEIAAIAGVAPINRDSGTKKGYRKTLAGRPAVKRALYMAALVASRFNPVLKVYYQKLIEKGKAPKVALMALMRKLVLILNAMQRDKLDWEDLSLAKLI